MSKFFERQLTDMYTQVVQTENWRLRLIPLVASSIAETVLGGTVFSRWRGNAYTPYRSDVWAWLGPRVGVR